MESTGKIIETILDNKDSTCMAHLIVTLEMNKIESDYQHPENPAIFQREYDEVCLTKRFAISSFYREIEGEIMRRMKNLHKIDFLEKKASDTAIILKTTPKKLERTLSAFRLENAILDRVKQKCPGCYKNLCPMLQKSYDEAGFVKSYSISFELEKIK